MCRSAAPLGSDAAAADRLVPAAAAGAAGAPLDTVLVESSDKVDKNLWFRGCLGDEDEEAGSPTMAVLLLLKAA